MSAAAQKASVKYPNKIVASTKKDELYNAILEWFIKDGLYWQSNEVENGTAKNTIRTQDVFWYLDDHHVIPADGLYKKFNEVFGTSTTEEERPSLQKISKK